MTNFLVVDDETFFDMVIEDLLCLFFGSFFILHIFRSLNKFQSVVLCYEGFAISFMSAVRLVYRN